MKKFKIDHQLDDWDRILIDSLREDIKEFIRSHGKHVSAGRTFEQIDKMQQDGFWNYCGGNIKDWFYIYRNESIWWLDLYTGDGGCWSDKGAMIDGYYIPYREDFSKILRSYDDKRKKA